jgi:hypothetical protein
MDNALVLKNKITIDIIVYTVLKHTKGDGGTTLVVV